jgi:hypothetical protein
VPVGRQLGLLMLANGLADRAVGVVRRHGQNVVRVVVRPLEHGFGARPLGRPMDQVLHLAEDRHELGVMGREVIDHPIVRLSLGLAPPVIGYVPLYARSVPP